jgi:predicted GH43/DUF377 family glycosyl hydrolase
MRFLITIVEQVKLKAVLKKMCVDSQLTKLIKFFVLPIVLAFSACQQPATVVPPRSLSAPSATLTQSAEEEPFFEPYQNNPVFSHGKQGSWFEDSVEPGAIVFHDGKFHMFFNGIKDWPAKVSIGYATSTDGIRWALGLREPILDSSMEKFPGFTFFVSSVVIGDDGIWRLYYYTLDEGRDGAPGAIGIATATDPSGPWELQSDFVLRPGPKGAWDGSRVTQPSVLSIDEGYLMFFAGFDTDRLMSTRMIGLATSRNGFEWTKYDDQDTGGTFSESDPVLEVGRKGEWDANRIFQPQVVQVNDGFLMLYKSNIKIGSAEAYGLALSPNGINWMRYDKNPIIAEKTYPVEWLRKGYSELLYHEGILYLFLEILEREGGVYPQGNSEYFSNIYLFTHEGLPE